MVMWINLSWQSILNTKSSSSSSPSSPSPSPSSSSSSSSTSTAPGQDNQPYSPEMKHEGSACGRFDPYMMVLVRASFKLGWESIYRGQPDFIKREWRILCLQASLSYHSLADSPRFSPEVIQLDSHTWVAYMVAGDEIIQDPYLQSGNPSSKDRDDLHVHSPRCKASFIISLVAWFFRLCGETEALWEEQFDLSWVSTQSTPNLFFFPSLHYLLRSACSLLSSQL